MQQQMQQDGAGGWRCVAAAAAGSGLGQEKAGYIAGLVVLAVVPQLLVALGLYLFIRWVRYCLVAAERARRCRRCMYVHLGV
jgi:hypothetical protein